MIYLPRLFDCDRPSFVITNATCIERVSSENLGNKIRKEKCFYYEMIQCESNMVVSSGKNVETVEWNCHGEVHNVHVSNDIVFKKAVGTISEVTGISAAVVIEVLEIILLPYRNATWTFDKLDLKYK